jgi:flagellar biosynthesis/type III secretory pathway protein FliH
MSAEVVRFHAAPRTIALAGTKIAPTFSEDDLEAARRDGYKRGSEEATKLLERQMLEQRTEMVRVQNETFAALTERHAALVQQLNEALPEMVLEAVARVLAQTTLDRDGIVRIVADLLEEVAQDREKIEVQLAPRDLELIAGYEEHFREKHPALTFHANPELRSGDCTLHTHFGIIDGRLSTKLRALEELLR